MEKIKTYTNSVQHNVIATAIDNLNDSNRLSYIEKSKIGTNECTITNETDYKLSTLHAMSEILNEIHRLGYKIVKGK
jgi:hypothetical protein